MGVTLTDNDAKFIINASWSGMGILDGSNIPVTAGQYLVRVADDKIYISTLAEQNYSGTLRYIVPNLVNK